MNMSILVKKYFLVVFLCFTAAASALARDARDESDATKAANKILESIQQKKYEFLWDSQTSDFFKSQTTKNSFVSNMAIGRLQLGAPGKSELAGVAYSQSSDGFNGEIYSFNYVNVYAAGKFYERIVVIKEADGKFRMSGLWGAPAQ